RFTSNASVVNTGWELMVSCGPPLPPAPAINGVCGTTVYDPGGATGNYVNGAFVTTTYCPTVPGEVVTMTFNQFATEQNFDFVTIFNGPDVTAPSLGTFSGTNIPGPFISTHPSGCLTLRFTSDGSIVASGWAATLRCGPPQPPPPPPPPPTGLCGTTVYDPGGPNGNYFNATNQNPANVGGNGCWPTPCGTVWSQTYCPDVVGDAVTLSFTSFAIENGWDNVYVYNGPVVSPYNANGTQFIGPAGLPTCGGPAGWCNQTLGPGGFTGNVIPGPFTSTHPSGCLTISMTSDDIVNLPGWAATVQCQSAFNPNADCVYALRLYDVFGDGWAGSSITVTINGGSPSTYTIQSGTFNQVLLGLDAGDVVSITYSGLGYFPTDNYWTLDLVGSPYAQH
ncbi:MAG: CUB domain-containing protein, partial [Flavobacteriales bacterium]